MWSGCTLLQVDKASAGAGRAALLSTLDAQRDHILGAVEGIPEEELRRPVLPSKWTILGLIHHLAIDVERFWFRRVVAGETVAADGDSASAWQVPPEMAAQSILELYRREIELANAIIRETALDAPPAWWPEENWGGWRLHNLNEVMLHGITETALHAGHLDAVRELIDGHQWLVLT
jgi:uncharacterized damage-inducible protein DinB